MSMEFTLEGRKPTNVIETSDKDGVRGIRLFDEEDGSVRIEFTDAPEVPPVVVSPIIAHKLAPAFRKLIHGSPEVVRSLAALLSEDAAHTARVLEEIMRPTVAPMEEE